MLDVIDAETATCVDMNFSLVVLDDELGVFNNIDSRSNVTRQSYLKSILGIM